MEEEKDIMLLTGNIKYVNEDGDVKEYKINSLEDLEKFIAEGDFELDEDDKWLLNKLKQNKVETLSIPRIIKLLPDKDRIIDLFERKIKKFNLADVLNYVKKKGYDPESFAKFLRLFKDEVLNERLKDEVKYYSKSLSDLIKSFKEEIREECKDDEGDEGDAVEGWGRNNPKDKCCCEPKGYHGPEKSLLKDKFDELFPKCEKEKPCCEDYGISSRKPDFIVKEEGDKFLIWRL